MLLDDAWEGGTYVTVTGPVDPDTPAASGRLAAAIAWTWVADGRMGAVVEEVPFEPRVYSYSLSVVHPPERAEAVDAPPPLDQATDAAFLLGTAVLVEAATDAPVALHADPRGLLEAQRTGVFPAGLVVPDEPGAARVLGVWASHRLAAFAGRSGDHSLVGVAGWPADGPLCELDGLEGGLTLYRDDGGACGRWSPVAPAGDRTEFQGVPLGPL